MSHHPRRILTPGPGSLRKRKEMEAAGATSAAATTTTTSPKATEPVVSSNRLLAGYMAHEFLTKGTLLGQKWDPARAEAMPVSAGFGGAKRKKPGQSQSAEAEPSGRLKQQQEQESYAELANLLKANGAHIPGIVNPTQLGGWVGSDVM